MKLSTLIAAGGLAVAAMAGPGQAATVTKTTTVTRVHGPMHLLPHHNHKYCRTRWVHHRRTTKCWYH